MLDRFGLRSLNQFCLVCDGFLGLFRLTSFCLLLAFKLLVKWLAWRENRYQYLRGFVFANGVLFLELSFFWPIQQ